MVLIFTQRFSGPDALRYMWECHLCGLIVLLSRTCWTKSRARGVAWVKTSMRMLWPGSSRIKHPMSNHLETFMDIHGFYTSEFIHTYTLDWIYTFRRAAEQTSFIKLCLLDNYCEVQNPLTSVQSNVPRGGWSLTQMTLGERRGTPWTSSSQDTFRVTN